MYVSPKKASEWSHAESWSFCRLQSCLLTQCKQPWHGGVPVLASFSLCDSVRCARRNVPQMPSKCSIIAPRGLRSKAPCKMWAMHSQPAMVDTAYWCGDVAVSSALPNCWSMVRATVINNDASHTPPSGFDNVVIFTQLDHFDHSGAPLFPGHFLSHLNNHTKNAHVAAHGAKVFCGPGHASC